MEVEGPEDPGRLLRGLAGSRRTGSLAAVVAQALAVGLMFLAGAYPSWVLVSGDEVQFVLGAVWALNPIAPPPDSPLLGPAGVPLILSIAICCLVAILSGCSALLLDFLGLQQACAAAPFLHGLAALLALGAAALCSCLFEVTRSRLQTEKELQPLRLTSTFGPSFFMCILACALAAAATGFSCSASARLVTSVHSQAGRRGRRGPPLVRPREDEVLDSQVVLPHCREGEIPVGEKRRIQTV